ncbi:MAG: GNAT family N-acetyltransferase [Clostridia bacterium]|nr:GNAT family N-acetyltransferase [Clostridia bacterium]
MEIRIATIKELENWWDAKIENKPEDLAYPIWKKTFVEGNKNGERKTFFVFDDGKYAGQGTILLKSTDKDMTGKDKAEIIKLEIDEEYRGKGVATLIYEAIEKYAKKTGIKTLTIGVEPKEVRNMQIYFHWGFTNYIKCTTETFPARDVLSAAEIITVLCYYKEI